MKLSTWIFLRGLAIVYVIAFTSAWVQVDGLFGETGILPVADYLSTLKTKYGTQSYIYAPSLVLVRSWKPQFEYNLWAWSSSIYFSISWFLYFSNTFSFILGLSFPS